MADLNFKEILDQSNIPVFIINLASCEISFRNSYCDKFSWIMTNKGLPFKDWDQLSTQLGEQSETVTQLRVKNEKKKNFIFDFTLKKVNDLVFCFGENKTEINEHKIMIKSFTTMVEQANKKIKQKSLELENILNTMHQATFMINNKLIVESPVSAFSNVIFDQEILDQEILNLLYNNMEISSEALTDVKSAFTTVFGEDETQWDLMHDLFPTEGYLNISDKKKYISISTYPIWNDQKSLERIMLVIQDLTEVNKLQDENKEKDKKVQIIQELAEQEPRDISQYFRSSSKLLAQSKALLEILENNPQLIDDVFRNMHTLKGNSRLFNLSLMSQCAHEVENTIKEMNEKGYINGDLHKRLASGHEQVGTELTHYSKIAKDILKISDANVDEHVTNLISMLLEIECHLQAGSKKSLGNIDTALAACSSWALALDDDIISSFIFEINRLILNEDFNYEFHVELFTSKVNETLNYLYDQYQYSYTPEVDFESNALSFILELSQICINKSKKLRTPSLRALYVNSSSIVLRKLYELKVLNTEFNDDLILKSLGYEVALLAKKFPNFTQNLKDKAIATSCDLSFLNNDLPIGILSCAFSAEKALLKSKTSGKVKKKKTIEIYNNELEEIIHFIESSTQLDSNDILSKIHYLTYDCVKERIEKFKNLIEGIAYNSKKQCQFLVEGVDFRLPPEKCNLLMDALLHLVTNSIDHGIETYKERIAQNKDEIGRIIVDISEQKDHLKIIVSDDGKGIDPQIVYEKAKGLNLVSKSSELSNDQMLELIFHPGLSTKEVVNETSGRGIGMNVVKNNIEIIKGEIQIQSEISKGTTFSITIPKL